VPDTPPGLASENFLREKMTMKFGGAMFFTD